jgi:DNA primase large subunit
MLEGLKEAHDQFFNGSARNKPDYPKDADKLYGFAEEEFFSLFDAIKLKQHDKARSAAGRVIITMSEIIELVEELQRKKIEKEYDVAREYEEGVDFKHRGIFR